LAMNRIIHLARDGVEVLLCGAISRQCMFTGEAMGIKVHSFLSGSYAEVLASFLEKGVPALLKYRMPGCRNAGRRNRRRGRGGRRND
jgi:predicted Fe-Mo cluster-binding NifX family protein